MRDLSVRCLQVLESGAARRGAEAPLLIVRDESHRLSLGELLSSIARFRFTGCFYIIRVAGG